MINRNHPDYPKLLEEYQTLQAEWRAAKTALPKFTGLDGPSVKIDKEYDLKLKELQAKYAHVYVDKE